MRYNAVIFDLFGTLVDYLPKEDYTRAFTAIAEALAVPVADFRTVWRDCMAERDTGRFGSVNNDLAHACRCLGAAPSPEQLAAAAQIRYAIYRRNLAPRAGAEEVLQELAARGLRRGMISNCAHEIPDLWAETVFAPLFECAVFSPVIGITKPDPRIYRQCCAGLDVAPERCLYVGDGSSFELAGARAVGMTPVLICVPYEREAVMGKDEPRTWQGPVIDHLPAMLDLLEEG